MTSANVAQWHKADGDTVSKGDILLTIETDRVSQELEAEIDGVLEIITPEGEEVDIGTVVAKISEGGEAAAEPEAKVEAEPEPEPTPDPEPKPEPEKSAPTPVAKVETPKPAAPAPVATPAPKKAQPVSGSATEGRNSRKKMSMLRRKIASNLVNAQQTAAILTTFNEVDMSAIMKLRKEVQEDFIKKHDCKHGFI